MRPWLLWLVIVTLPMAAAAETESRPTYQSLLLQALGTRHCEADELSDSIRISCRETLTVWFFTKPNHFAHPGVVLRKAEEREGRWHMTLNGWSFGPDSAQPAFKAWLDQFRAIQDKLTNPGQVE